MTSIKTITATTILLITACMINLDESTAQALIVENTTTEAVYVSYIHRNGNGGGETVHQGSKVVPAGQSKTCLLYTSPSPRDS